MSSYFLERKEGVQPWRIRGEEKRKKEEERSSSEKTQWLMISVETTSELGERKCSCQAPGVPLICEGSKGFLKGKCFSGLVYMSFIYKGFMKIVRLI